ncbi:hypothetical protein F444_08176 [Phytophthora nicotianae P1976]|uniref:Reverse transcriptase domain-containing protein n=1 Tax=Phytophthora nicotianae P1976 TaxID=1317066 RepID=A0A081AC12_PHYNI|nr:hypothetical protein F444_08176 [Phytophthora nicotianae P1976]
MATLDHQPGNFSSFVFVLAVIQGGLASRRSGYHFSSQSQHFVVGPLSPGVPIQIFFQAHRVRHQPLHVEKGVRFLLMVKSTFRLVPVHHETSSRFVGHVPEKDLVVVDLLVPIWWTGSPAYYGLFGGAIAFLVRRGSPSTLNPSNRDDDTFFCYDWVDDYVLVEPDKPGRLEACAAVLRLAMMATLGPRSINEKKFTSWSTNLVDVGLEWDTEFPNVSMPEVKIEKARLRIQAMRSAQRTTKTELAKLLGSLRHVCICVRPGKPFFQRLIMLWKRVQ